MYVWNWLGFDFWSCSWFQCELARGRAENMAADHGFSWDFDGGSGVSQVGGPRYKVPQVPCLVRSGTLNNQGTVGTYR